MSRAINIDASPLKRRRARPPEEDVWSRAEAQITCSDTDNLSKNMQNITTLLSTARVDNQPSHPCHHCGKKHKGIRKAISSKYWNTTSRMMGNRDKLAQQTTSEALQSNKAKLLTRRINSRCFFPSVSILQHRTAQTRQRVTGNTTAKMNSPILQRKNNQSLS